MVGKDASKKKRSITTIVGGSWEEAEDLVFSPGLRLRGLQLHIYCSALALDYEVYSCTSKQEVRQKFQPMLFHVPDSVQSSTKLWGKIYCPPLALDYEVYSCTFTALPWP